jgi:YidC/Oxa1 family membrane protein insertase
MFEIPSAVLSWFYGHTNSYALAIALMSVVVMAITTPLTLKSTKGMLEMQRLAPEMRRLQNEYRNDRQKLNEEMMKLYQEHKVNPMASCLPLVAQTPVFIIMFRILRGLIYQPTPNVQPVADATMRALGESPDQLGFIPRYLPINSDMYQSLFGKHEMVSLGLDLALSPVRAISESVGEGIIYALFVVLLAGLYFAQQRMVAARASVSPTMSPTQQKLMQYLPVVFAVFQMFFMLGLVIYYICQTILRIGQQAYITRRFYGHEEALGRQAQRAGEAARAEAAKRGESGGFFAQAKRDLMGGGEAEDASSGGKSGAKSGGKSGGKSGEKSGAKPQRAIESKRVTPRKETPPPPDSKGRPTPSRKDAQTGRANDRSARPKSTRPRSSGRKRR